MEMVWRAECDEAISWLSWAYSENQGHESWTATQDILESMAHRLVISEQKNDEQGQKSKHRFTEVEKQLSGTLEPDWLKPVRNLGIELRNLCLAELNRCGGVWFGKRAQDQEEPHPHPKD